MPSFKQFLHKVVVRVCDTQMNERLGLLIDDAVRRPVTFRANLGDLTVTEETLDGLVLVGPADGPNGVEDIARQITRCLVKILATDEVWWLPVNASRDPVTRFWSVECVPLLLFTRATSRTDEQILRASGYDPETRERPTPTGWLCKQCGEPNKSEWAECRNCGSTQREVTL